MADRAARKRAYLQAFSDYTLRALAAALIGPRWATSLGRDELLDILAVCIAAAPTKELNKMTDKPYMYALAWSAGPEHHMLGIYSTLDLAKSEAQRYHRKTPLVWSELETDNKRLAYHEAPLTDWCTSGAKIMISRYRLDGKKFR